MAETRIKVWIVKKKLRHKHIPGHFITVVNDKSERVVKLTKDINLPPRDIFFSLRATQHPANRFRSLLKRQKVDFTETIEWRPAPNAEHGDPCEDYYVFRY